MIKVSYKQKYNTVFIEFAGKIDAAQLEESLSDVEKAAPKTGEGFKVLTDLSLVQSIDSKIIPLVKKSMDFLNKQGATEVIRVIPDPGQDIGFNILSLFHYSKNVKIITVKSREEAEALL